MELLILFSENEKENQESTCCVPWGGGRKEKLETRRWKLESRKLESRRQDGDVPTGHSQEHGGWRKASGLKPMSYKQVHDT